MIRKCHSLDNLKNRKKNNRGYTLVELVVVMMIMAICLGLAVWGISGWRDWADFKRQNEYAQTLFVAAQNQLTEYSENGLLQELSENLPKNGSDYACAFSEEDMNTITDSEGVPLDLEKLWPASSGKTNAFRYQGKICHIQSEKGDYTRYENGEFDNGADPEKQILFDILSSYTYDPDILNEVISLEFSPEDGQVYAVLYSDKNDTFLYPCDSRYSTHVNATRGEVNVAVRSYDALKKRMIGYYGVDTLSRATSVKTEKPSLAEVMLNNEETLNLSFYLQKNPEATNQLNYEITVYNTKNVALMQINVDGSKIKRKLTGISAGDSNVQKCQVTFAGDDKKVTDVPILAWTEAKKKTGILGSLTGQTGSVEVVRIVLDAADLSATSKAYLSSYPELFAHSAVSATGKESSVAIPSEGAFAYFYNTLSFHRFGLTDDDIYCVVKGSGTLYKTTAPKKTNTENAYFASRQKTEGKAADKYNLENCRHLYNIRYAEDYTPAERSGKTTLDGFGEYVLKADMSWDTFTEEGNLYNGSYNDWKAVIKDTEDSGDVSTCFPSFRQLRRGSSFSSEGTKPHKIHGLYITQTANIRQGLYTDNPILKEMDSALTQMKETDSIESLSVQVIGEEGNPKKTKTQTIAGIAPTGLFLVNYGQISKVTLEAVSVTGGDYVGGFCGINGFAGKQADGQPMISLENLTVTSKKESDSEETENTEEINIRGRKYVGGIVGGQWYLPDNTLLQDIAGGKKKDEITVSGQQIYRKLSNRAKVSGQLYVGGIIGMLEVKDRVVKATTDGEKGKNLWLTSHLTVKLSECSNYGNVMADSRIWTGEEDFDPTYCRFIGGIAGCLRQESEEEQGLLLEDCVSSPQYSSEDIARILSGSSSVSLEHRLNGVYVGGITGYNDGGIIRRCSTKKEEGQTEEGYIFGYQYVGGIVGYNKGSLSGRQENGEKGRSQAHVIGDTCVGGITGCNAPLPIGDKQLNHGHLKQLETGKIPQPEEDRNLSLQISDWVNEGAVVSVRVTQKEGTARNGYVGGIVGYNAGRIFGCSSEVNSTDTVRKVTKATAREGDYAGGIAGYNNGIIGNTPRNEAGQKTGASEGEIHTVSYITGENCVGGIVGYNDVDAIVEDYTLNGGYIISSGSFVGGYVGWNSSVYLLADYDENPKGTARSIVCKPNEVSGRYCVGGSIGANVLPVSRKKGENETIISGCFETDNFLGNIVADGGFSGENTVDGAFAGGFIGYNRLIDGNVNKKRIRAFAEGFGNSLRNLRIYAGEEWENKESLLEGKISDKNAADLDGEKIKNLPAAKNCRFVITGENDSKETSAKLGKIRGGIFVGGVIGYNQEDTALTIRNVENKTPVEAELCVRNRKEQTARTYDDEEFTYSYAGGIIGRVSKNAVIDNCRNAEVGDVHTEGTYLGGICEINEGRIKNCQVSSFGTSAHDYVGGIAGINKSGAEITGCTIDNKTIVGGSYVGGITAENYGTIRMTGKSVVNIKADGKEGCVGGIVGYNEGAVVSTSSEATVSGLVSGQKNVGGVIGKNTGRTLSGLFSDASVSAVQGNAGGIVGVFQTKVSESASIKNCINQGRVTAIRAGNAGGIVADNAENVSVTGCTNHGEVSAPNGSCGGIAAINAGIIEDSRVFPEGKKLTFEGLKEIGGICAKNTGTIKDVQVSKVLVCNTAKSNKSDIGLIAGVNSGRISFTESGKTAVDEDSVAEVMTAGSRAGGIVGTNEGGSLEGDASGTYVKAALRFAKNTKGTYASFGGVAGEVKGGNLRNFRVQSEITGNMGSESTGYGGVVGVNSGNISNCEYEGKLLVNGSADNVVNLGGIAGKNEKQGNISCCVIGRTQDTRISSGNTNKNAASGYVGGMVGWNYGTVRSCDNASFSGASQVEIIGYAGHLGGIVGCNMAGAMVSGSKEMRLSTGRNWKVLSNYYANDCGTGGIIGYNGSGQNISHVTNHASVATTYNAVNVAAGGLIGRLENKEASSMIIQDVDNYGPVSGNNGTVGGLIGRIKYKAITFRDCCNYGTILNSRQYAGGIIGSLYQIDGGMEQIFDSCINYGNVSGYNGIAGILGQEDAKVSMKVTMTNCVNVGCLVPKNSSTVCGGMAALQSKGTYRFYRCRNYGNYTGTAPDIFGGITPKNYEDIADCFSLSNVEQLVCVEKDKANTQHNYYVTNAGAPDDYNRGGVKKGLPAGVKKETDSSYTIYDYFGVGHLSIAKDIFKAGTREELDSSPVSPDVRDDASAYVAKGEAGTAGLRQQVYEAVDPKIQDYYKNRIPDDTLPTPKNIQLVIGSPEGNQLKGGEKMTWNWEVSSTEYYEQQVVFVIRDGEKTLYTSAPENISFGINSYTLPDNIQERYEGKEIILYVRTISGQYVDSEYDESVYGPEGTGKQEHTSAWGAGKKELIKKKHTIPKVHLELVNSPEYGNKARYQAVLENPEDYTGDRATVIKVQLKNENGATLYTNSSTNNCLLIDMTGEHPTGRSGLFDNASYSNNGILVSWAEANDTFSQSSAATVQFCFYGTDALKSTNYVNTVFNDFYGDSTANWYNSITMTKGHSTTELYANSELVLNDYTVEGEEGIRGNFDMVVSSGVSHVTSFGNESVSQLSGLPETMLDSSEITVRVYPWQSQSYTAWYGHSIESYTGISNDTLKARMKAAVNPADSGLSVEEQALLTEIFSVEAADGESVVSLNSGYVLRRNSEEEEETYDIFYSCLLENREVYQQQIDEKTYRIENGKVVYDNKEKDIRPEPVIDTTKNPRNGYEYTFFWDRDEKAEEDAEYELQLWGVQEKNQEVEVLLDAADVNKDTVSAEKNCYHSGKNEQEDTEKYWSYTFTDTERNWKYTKLKLKVVRKGLTTGQNKTEIFPAFASEEFSVLLDLSQIARPTLNVHKKDGVVQKNTLIYDIWWDTVPEEERPFVSSYEVKVKRENGESRTWNFTEGTDDVSLNKIVAQLDLNDYNRGEKLSVTVRALAKTKEEKPEQIYCDGPEGVERVLTLPSRLDVPTVTDMTISREYAREDYMTLEELKKDGLTFTLQAEGSPATLQQAKYEIVMAVYEEAPDELYDTGRILAGDAPKKDADGYWNSGAAETLITKEKPEIMSGNLETGKYTLKKLSEKFSEDYAGKWLKIAVRSISDSNISSWWSDEDADGESVNYRWFHIPRFRFPKGQTATEEESMYPMIQTARDYELVRNADCYQFTIVHSQEDAGDKDLAEQGYIRYEADWIYLLKNESRDAAYDVYFASTLPGEESYHMTKGDTGDVNLEDSIKNHMVKLGTLDASGSYVKLPREETPEFEDDNGKMRQIRQAVSYLQLVKGAEDENDHVKLVLPDTELANGEKTEKYLFTSQVSFRARAAKEQTSANYEDSQIVNWYRKGTADTVTDAEEVTLQKEPDAPEVTLFKVPVTDAEGNTIKGENYFELCADENTPDKQRYRLNAEATDGSWLLWQIWMDTDGNGILDKKDTVYIMSSDGYGVSNIDVLWTLPEEFLSYAGNIYKIRYAGIDVTGATKQSYNLTQWSSFFSGRLPKLPVPAEEEQTENDKLESVPTQKNAAKKEEPPVKEQTSSDEQDKKSESRTEYHNTTQTGQLPKETGELPDGQKVKTEKTEENTLPEESAR